MNDEIFIIVSMVLESQGAQLVKKYQVNAKKTQLVKKERHAGNLVRETAIQMSYVAPFVTHLRCDGSVVFGIFGRE